MIYKIPDIHTYLIENKDDSILKLYHYSQIDGLTTLDPNKAHPNSYSRDDYLAWSKPRIFYYTDKTQKKIDKPISGHPHLYEVDVDKNKIYDINLDEKSYFLQAKKIRSDIEDKIFKRRGKNFVDDLYRITIDHENPDQILDNFINFIKNKYIIKDNSLQKISDNVYTFEINYNNRHRIESIMNMSDFPEINIDFYKKGDRVVGLPNIFDELFNIIDKLGYIGISYSLFEGKKSDKIVVIWIPMNVTQIK